MFRLKLKRCTRSFLIAFILLAVFLAGVVSRDCFISDALADEYERITKNGTLTVKQGFYEGVIDGKTVIVGVDKPHIIQVVFYCPKNGDTPTLAWIKW